MDKLWDWVWNWLTRQLSELRHVPVAVGAVFVCGAFVAWLATNTWKDRFYAERFAVMDARIAALQERQREPIPAPEDKPAPQREPATPPKEPSAEKPGPPSTSPVATRDKQSKAVPSQAATGVTTGAVVAPGSVFSIGQQGGITAGNVSINAPNPPRLTTAHANVIESRLRNVNEKPSEVSVGCFISDNDSCYVAKQLATVLGQIGWKCSLAMLPASAEGFLIEASEGSAAAASLRDALGAAGLPVTLRTRPNDGRTDNVSVIVGPIRQ